MSEPIRCFLLTERVRVNCSESSPYVYETSDGRCYHLGDHPITTESGEAIDPAPVGAMWDCDWMHGCHENDTCYDRNNDGMVLCVRTPGGDWVIDAPSRNGGFWSRTGTAPDITVTPSIVQPGYHGWLRDGCLVEV